MNNQEVVALLEQCKQKLESLASEVSEPSEEEKNDYQQCKDSLPEDLTTLIQEAKEMKWPFVPEKWQYKQAIAPEDKTNLQDMINPRLHDLLVFLKASIAVVDRATAVAIVFLIDRFLYWADASTRLLRVTKALHKLWPETPIAPQVVIRQARISANSGKLLKAEYILSSLIINNGTTGSWHYANENDRVLVQSVCIQIRGQILQKLGMWYEAAELIWASIVGFSELPIPDKKGIATSLGILADIFISMSEEDYQRFKNSSHVCLSLLEEFDHRLLSAAEACKLAATFSLYTPLFVLTNLNIRGTCLLSYSLSQVCPTEKRMHYLSEAKESFEIGLLTKKQGDVVTSKQELHSFVKSAFCLASVHRWIHTDSVYEKDVSLLCTEAMEKLAKYSMLTDKEEKGHLAFDIINLVGSIKDYLKVLPFTSSDECSYVPDGYKDCLKKDILNEKVTFSKVLDMFSHHHQSVCNAFESTCRNHRSLEVLGKSGACVTALKTLDTVSTMEDISCRTAGDSDPTSQKHGSRRRRFVRSNAVNHSLDDEKRKSFSRSHNDSSSHSLKSWSNVSNSSSSWESFNFNNEIELLKEGNVERSKMGSPSSMVASDCMDEFGPSEHKDPEDMSFEHLSIQEAETDYHAHHQYPLPNNVKTEPEESRYGSSGQNHLTNVDPFAETQSATDGITQAPDDTQDDQSFKDSIAAKMLLHGIDPKGETKDDTDDVPSGTHENLFTHQSSIPSSEGRLFYVTAKANLQDGCEVNDLNKQLSMDSSCGKLTLQQQKSTSSLYSTSSSKSVLPAGADFACESTEEEEDKLNLSLSSNQGSSFWSKSAQFSSSLSDSNSLLNSSGSSFVFLRSNDSEELRHIPSLDVLEYEQLLSGVNNEWLLKRLEGTEKISSIPLNKAYNGLLLKFSKKSELWTAQETSVYFGDYVKVTKPGQQRNAFWVHCLHQDETLGRYVGKEYKKQRNILYHFNDVERQMTAQYYVTEFNKRLYEMSIPTQLFYIPSSLLLILEDKTIKGCVTVEPYVLGEFVKLSNNKEIVKTQYEATKYGLAFGHFTYEFSGHSDIVVDLQGWVTGSKKGEALIYLTDPQIHSVKNISAEATGKREVTCTNFGKRGIMCFFSQQHEECNDICRSLSLTRPDLRTLKTN
ncbi:alpha-protein kinase 1 [Pelodytes ibericus]